MTFGDLNFLTLIFILFFFSVALNVNTALHLLLTAELLWISLYILVLTAGFVFDNLNLLSLTFFFLILSAVEFGIGLVLILLQYLFLRSINLNDWGKNYIKFSLRFSNKLKHHQFFIS